MIAKRFGVRGSLWLVAQAGLSGCALLMSWLSDAPRILTIWLGLAGLTAIAPRFFPHDDHGKRLSKRSVLAGWLCLSGVLATVAFVLCQPASEINFCDFYYGLLAALQATVALITAFRETDPAGRNQWFRLALGWCFLADLACLGEAFQRNARMAFVAGLFAFATLLIAYKALLRLPFLVIQFINTLILLAIGLPILECILHPPHTLALDPASLRNYHTYRAAKKDRAAFAQWWNYYAAQEAQMNERILGKDATNEPVYLRPGSQANFMQALIKVNSRGFRGREIPEHKGDACRIVVLGESTTFGYTLDTGDKPWPELLEQMIHERLKLSRPVEVINAGVPSSTLPDNLARLPTKILPLQPDLIICYHGINGFYLLDQGVPPLVGPAPPAYHRRPLQILADAEYGFRLKCYLRRQTAGPSPAPPPAGNGMESSYAKAYEELIGVARTNHIRLVIANFPLAVNTRSSPDLVEFFRPRYPHVAEMIRANATFGLMVQELARQHPEVTLVDVHPHLDGEDELFLDLIHLTQKGDRRLAETFYAALKGLLESAGTNGDG